MSFSDSCTEDNLSQRFGLSADSPILITSSPASPISSCDTFSDQGTEELDVNPAMDPESSDAIPNNSSSHGVGDTTTIPPTDSGDRIRALMAKYEQVMSGEAAQTQCVSSDILATQGEYGGNLPDSHDQDGRSVDKPTKTYSPYEKSTSCRTRHVKKDQPARAGSRVQKKSATVSRRQVYTFERLGGARRVTSGIIEYQVCWEPTWLPIKHLEGNDAIDEAKKLVVDLFGSDSWHEEVRSLGLTL